MSMLSSQQPLLVDDTRLIKQRPHSITYVISGGKALDFAAPRNNPVTRLAFAVSFIAFSQSFLMTTVIHLTFCSLSQLYISFAKHSTYFRPICISIHPQQTCQHKRLHERLHSRESWDSQAVATSLNAFFKTNLVTRDVCISRRE